MIIECRVLLRNITKITGNITDGNIIHLYNYSAKIWYTQFNLPIYMYTDIKMKQTKRNF